MPSRLPATYAAAVAVFNAMRERSRRSNRAPCWMCVPARNGDFRGGSAFETLDNVRLIDANAELRRLALTLMAEAAQGGNAPRGGRWPILPEGNALAVAGRVEPATSWSRAMRQASLRDSELRVYAMLWAATAGALVIIEPGTRPVRAHLAHARRN